MKNRKRFLCTVTAVLTAAGMLSGCSADSSGDGGAEYVTTNAGTVAVNSGGDADKTPAGEAADPNAGRWDNSGVLQHADGGASDGGIVVTEYDRVMAEEAPADDTYPTGSTEGAGGWTESSYSYREYFNTEEYNSIVESGYKSVAANPLSTFSIDVDTASYANVRRMIQEGGYINPDAVRIEEFINYFDYSYPQPATDDPFSVTTELSDCPWNDETKLLLVGLKAEDIQREEREPLNLVFLIDVSGSMFSEDKLPLVQKAFSMLTDTLTEDDRISIVTYAGEENVVLKGTSGADKEKIKDAINSLEAGGSTCGEAGKE